MALRYDVEVSGHTRRAPGAPVVPAAAARPAADSLFAPPDRTFPESAPDTLETVHTPGMGSHEVAPTDIGAAFRAAGPTLASLLPLAFPEASIPEALAPYLGILRPVAGGLASAGTDAAIQTARGQRPDFSSVTRGAQDAGTLGLGELLGWLQKGGGTTLARRGLPVSDRALTEATDQAGSRVVSPGRLTSEIQDKAMESGTMPGGSRLPSGYEAMKGKQGALMTEREGILQSNAATTSTRQDITQYAQQERDALSRGINGTKNVSRFDNLLGDIVQQGTENPKVPLGARYKDPATGKMTFNKMKRMTPMELEADKERWAKYVKDWSAGNADKKTVADHLGRALARGAKERLEALTPPALPGGTGRIESINREYAGNLPLEYALQDAEKVRSGNVRLQPGSRIPVDVNTSGLQRLGGQVGVGMRNLAPVTRAAPSGVSLISRLLALLPADTTDTGN